MPTTKLGKTSWGLAEVRAVLQGALHLSSAKQARAALAASLDTLGYRSAPFLVNRGSLALKLALDAMKVQRPERSVVVVPAYCCPSVPRTVLAAGLTLRAAPVGADLNLDIDRLAPTLKGDVLAVVGVHMYALPLDTARLKSMAHAAGAYLIDDAAHVVERTDGRRSPLGLAGDAGLLSFNQSKTLTGGSPEGGGALFVADAALRTHIAPRYESLAEGKSRIRPYVWFALRYGIEITPRALTQYIWDFDIPLSWLTGAETERFERMAAPAALAVRAQVERLNEIVAGRTSLTGRYLQVLRNHPEIEFVQTATPRHLSRMFVRWKFGSNADEVRESLAQRGFATRTPYPPWGPDGDPTTVAARQIAATHLELPGSPSVTSEQIEELVSALALCLKSPST
ncbi:MAG: DegT/DnrJ/EryC1/StrS family aminotransferase [Alphaproteobacteria bacterium]|nr:DegT/DnrJ/EryC1/StrS family aminotransferase [Alphaproteobacteria bacterium]